MRRMKSVATGFLLGAAVVYITMKILQNHGVTGWTGYVEAAAEAGMVGGLADWFAVTALFKHPLGLPIPHTAIIPNRKDQFGEGLGTFVGENFLSENVIRGRLSSLGISKRTGQWLAQPENAARVTKELATAVRGVLAVLRDEDIQKILSEAVTSRLAKADLAVPLGGLLERFAASGGHHELVDTLAARAHDWLEANPEAIENTVSSEAPLWSPRFLDDAVARRIQRELVKLAANVRDDRHHALRKTLDRFLIDYAQELKTDPDTGRKVEGLKTELLNHPELQSLVASGWTAMRQAVIAASEDPDSDLQTRAREGLRTLGRRLESDVRLQEKADGWVREVAVHLVTTYRDQITSLITDTVAAWDGPATSRKIELQVGRDLQFIRINGTVVGALAGLVIYTLSQLAF
ncbi:DUF445 domain-containing protein [Catenulispora yoronensis]|uniref:DUF445 domain-containing protein n=2 Tax=Catenulispora yoronensis TaxID=450799 RepID=A0ABN2V8L3_9ACTN